MPRAKQFDPKLAVEKAMDVFWARGYEGASVQDLLDAMGINRFSMYETFGDKHRLFLASLDHYCQKTLGEILDQLEASEEGLPAIETHFEKQKGMIFNSNGRLGCLMTNSTIETAPHDPVVAARSQEHLERLRKGFSKQLEIARRKGQVRPDLDVEQTADFLLNSCQGLAVLMRADTDIERLDSVVRYILSTLSRS